MADRDFARSWGRWAAQLHVLTRRFGEDHPAIAERFRSWELLHDGVMVGVELAEEDERSRADPERFGVLHGDLNLSNFTYTPPRGEEWGGLCVFDWDQSCRGWFMYDVSMILFFPYMLHRALKAGMGWLGGSGLPAEAAEYDRWVDWVVEGYESVGGEGSVDRPAMHRMVELRRLFTLRFGERALREMDEDVAAGRATVESQMHMRVFLEWGRKAMA